MNKLNGSDIAWVFIGIPAVLGWIVVAVTWLIAPRLGTEPDYLLYGLCAMGIWYAIFALLFLSITSNIL